MKTYVQVSATVFAVVALLQALRVVRAWPLAIGGYGVPVAASVVATLLAGALAAWGWSSLRGGVR